MRLGNLSVTQKESRQATRVIQRQTKSKADAEWPGGRTCDFAINKVGQAFRTRQVISEEVGKQRCRKFWGTEELTIWLGRRTFNRMGKNGAGNQFKES